MRRRVRKLERKMNRRADENKKPIQGFTANSALTWTPSAYAYVSTMYPPPAHGPPPPPMYPPPAHGSTPFYPPPAYGPPACPPPACPPSTYTSSVYTPPAYSPPPCPHSVHASVHKPAYGFTYAPTVYAPGCTPMCNDTHTHFR